jgi:hypothetical protein
MLVQGSRTEYGDAKGLKEPEKASNEMFLLSCHHKRPTKCTNS